MISSKHFPLLGACPLTVDPPLVCTPPLPPPMGRRACGMHEPEPRVTSAETRDKHKHHQRYCHGHRSLRQMNVSASGAMPCALHSVSRTYDYSQQRTQTQRHLTPPPPALKSPTRWRDPPQRGGGHQVTVAPPPRLGVALHNGTHCTTQALRLQQVRYDLKKTFLPHLYCLCFWGQVTVLSPCERGGGLRGGIRYQSTSGASVSSAQRR